MLVPYDGCNMVQEVTSDMQVAATPEWLEALSMCGQSLQFKNIPVA